MATKAADRVQEGRIADASADLGRLAADMLQAVPAMPLHPLMTHPAAAIAAATAIGLGLSSQMAGAFLGAVQGAVEAAQKLAIALENQNAKAEAAVILTEVNSRDVEAKMERLKPAVSQKVKPVRRTVSAKAKAAEISVPASAATAPRARKSAKADDLKMISGIGPKLQQVLNDRGIRTFLDIASWTDADVARLDDELGFNGRISRDDWIGQAKAFAIKDRTKK
ncbi:MULTISPECIES: 5' DNA nuclease [unclassified Sinorhizobium]|uniref:5' DNA nuclease n=1 Tax=unclassified Sinorhizobium TaxID=2613772 RepID=UPI003523F4F0